MTMRVVCIGDLHLDQSTSGVDRFEEVGEALELAVKEAERIEADAFVFTGDLTDPHTVRSHRSITKLAEMQCRLWEQQITPIFVAGNHDVIEDGSGGCVLDVHAAIGAGHVFTRPSCIEFRTERFVEGGILCNVIALPFTASSHNYDPDAFIRSLSPAPKGRPVLVLGHLNLEGIAVGSETTEMPRGRDVFWPLKALKECFPQAMLIAGHYHAAQEYQGVHVLGSAVRLRFDEKDNSPSFTVLEV